MKNQIFFLLLILATAFSCRKDLDSTTITDSNYQPPVVVVTATLSGQILGPNGQVVSDALVRVGNKATVSDENGFYQFRNIEMNARGTYVTASRDGYFLGSDRLYPLPGSKNFSRIELLPKTIAGRISGSDGGTVDVSGASIVFPEGGVVDATGSLYTGEVSVAAQWLNPVADNIQDIMPGGLFGLNADSREVMMASLGMLAVELFDEAGNELQVAPGRAAELTFPVPAELLGNAPTEIPLWYFDEADGIWVEDGKAFLQDGNYVGSVSHFTFWNVDVPTGVELIFISGCAQLSDGTPLANSRLRIVAPSNIYTYAYGDTDANGYFSGYLPAGDLLTFEFYDECGVYHAFDVGPFDAETNIEECFVVPTAELLSITGELVDCDGNGIENGLVVARSTAGNVMTTTDADGAFVLNLSNCGDADVVIEAYDLEGNNTTGEQTFTVAGDVNIGQLVACDNPIEEFLNASTNGLDQFFVDISMREDSIFIDSMIIEQAYRIDAFAFDEDANAGHSFIMNLVDISVGSHSGEDVGFQYFIESNEGFWLECRLPCFSIDVNITSNEGPGGFLEGNYNGTAAGFDFMQMPITDAPVSGDFRVRIPE